MESEQGAPPSAGRLSQGRVMESKRGTAMRKPPGEEVLLFAGNFAGTKRRDEATEVGIGAVRSGELLVAKVWERRRGSEQGVGLFLPLG